MVGYTYDEFREFVMRFRQADLLAAVARRALELPARPGPGDYADTPPWAPAAVAKASICDGNRFSWEPVRADTVAWACFMYNNITPGELGQTELSSPFNILVRLAYEQFPYQESVYEELCRAEALFGGYSGRKPLEVLNGTALEQLLGAPLRQAVGVAILLHASAQVNTGFFDPAWIGQPQFAEVLAEVPGDQVQSVISTVFASSFEEFKQLAAQAPALPYLERYRFNPLAARPFVHLADGSLLAPVPQVIARKLSPAELYYPGMDRWGLPFARDMGELFEDYVGRQLKTLPGAVVHPEIWYAQRQDKLLSVDWIVVTSECVILVEAKATRVPAAARAGSGEAEKSFSKVIGKAYDQISRTRRAIAADVPEFAAIPAGRPVIGLVATLDPWYMVNSPHARELLPEPEVPTVVASARGLERLVAVGQRGQAGAILAGIAADPDRRTWDLSNALSGHEQEGDDNPLLRAAWERYPFRPEAAGGDPRPQR